MQQSEEVITCHIAISFVIQPATACNLQPADAVYTLRKERSNKTKTCTNQKLILKEDLHH